MRTAGTVLGIAGGALAILFAAITLFVGFLTFDTVPDILDDAMDFSEYYDDDFFFEGGQFHFDNGEFRFDSNFPFGVRGFFSGPLRTVATVWLVASCAIGIVGGVLGIVGGVLVRKKNVTAGVLLIVACVLAGFTGWGIIASLALLAGGILALVKEKPAQPYPPYPGYQPPYNPYPPQPPPPYHPYQPPYTPYPPYPQPYSPQPQPSAPGDAGEPETPPKTRE